MIELALGNLQRSRCLRVIIGILGRAARRMSSMIWLLDRLQRRSKIRDTLYANSGWLGVDGRDLERRRRLVSALSETGRHDIIAVDGH